MIHKFVNSTPNPSATKKSSGLDVVPLLLPLFDDDDALVSVGAPDGVVVVATADDVDVAIYALLYL